MNKHSRRLAVYLLPCLIALVASVAIRTVALFTDLNTAYGYFKVGTLSTISNSVVTLFVLFALSYLFFGAKESLRASFDSPATYLPSGVSATCAVLLGVSLFSYSASFAPATAGATSNLHLYLAIACGIFALPCSIHFFLNAYETENKNKIRAIFSIFTLVFFCLYTLMLYFDASLPLNSPAKVIDQLAFIFAALFFIYEARISLGREVWRGYIAFGLAAAIMCAYSSVPSLIFYFAKGHLVSLLSEENLFVFSIFVFIVSRLCLIFKLRAKDDEGGMELLREYAINRKTIVDEEEKMYKNAFAVQLTIDDLGEAESTPTDNNYDTDDIIAETGDTEEELEQISLTDSFDKGEDEQI